MLYKPPSTTHAASNSISRAFSLIATCLVLASCQQACGQLIFDFSETSTGGVRVTGVGSGTISKNRNTTNYEILDFDNDFLSDSIGSFALINADSVNGTLSSSSGASSSINGFHVNRSSDSTDDLGWTTTSRIKFRRNQTYTFSITAIFDSSTLAWADLIPGTYFDAGGGSPDEVFGSTTVEVESVPEPRANMIIAGAGLLGLMVVRSRRTKKRSGIRQPNQGD